MAGQSVQTPKLHRLFQNEKLGRNESRLDTDQALRLVKALRNATRLGGALFGSEVRTAYQLLARVLQHESRQQGFDLAATRDADFHEVVTTGCRFRVSAEGRVSPQSREGVGDTAGDCRGGRQWEPISTSGLGDFTLQPPLHRDEVLLPRQEGETEALSPRGLWGMACNGRAGGGLRESPPLRLAFRALTFPWKACRADRQEEPWSGLCDLLEGDPRMLHGPVIVKVLVTQTSTQHPRLDEERATRARSFEVLSPQPLHGPQLGGRAWPGTAAHVTEAG